MKAFGQKQKTNWQTYFLVSVFHESNRDYGHSKNNSAIFHHWIICIGKCPQFSNYVRCFFFKVSSRTKKRGSQLFYSFMFSCCFYANMCFMQKKKVKFKIQKKGLQIVYVNVCFMYTVSWKDVKNYKFLNWLCFKFWT